MDEMKTVTDLAGLVSDLREHFFEMKLAIEHAWSMVPQGWVDGCLGEIDTACRYGNYDRILELALDEGMDLDKYCSTEPTLP